jgi:cytoskeletal protein CcmA (bactofilin family)
MLASPLDLGPTTVIRGEITAEEDLLIEGLVEGTVRLPKHHLVIGPRARLEADVFARQVTIAGHARGTITASERIEIESSATVEGEIIAPRIVLVEGAYFSGRVDPKRAEAAVAVAQYRLNHA